MTQEKIVMSNENLRFGINYATMTMQLWGGKEVLFLFQSCSIPMQSSLTELSLHIWLIPFVVKKAMNSLKVA